MYINFNLDGELKEVIITDKREDWTFKVDQDFKPDWFDMEEDKKSKGFKMTEETFKKAKQLSDRISGLKQERRACIQNLEFSSFKSLSDFEKGVIKSIIRYSFNQKIKLLRRDLIKL